MMNSVTYLIPEGTFKEILSVTFEIYAVTGLAPRNIVHNNLGYAWNIDDVRSVQHGRMSEEAYKEKNLIPF